MKSEPKQKYIVYDTKVEAPDVLTLRLIPQEKSAPSYISGQYITIYFPETGTPEGKAYSISSAPSEQNIAITVKAMGEFSHRLTSLHPGDVVTASLPGGYFYSESNQTHIIMVAAGIGVAPFRSMIVDSLEKNPARKITLFYSTRTKEEIIFRKKFDELQALHPSFTVRYFVTREQGASSGMMQRRITGEDIGACVRNESASEFMLCGSISFVRDLWRSLHILGIPEDTVYTEAFFSH